MTKSTALHPGVCEHWRKADRGPLVLCKDPANLLLSLWLSGGGKHSLGQWGCWRLLRGCGQAWRGSHSRWEEVQSLQSMLKKQRETGRSVRSMPMSKWSWLSTSVYTLLDVESQTCSANTGSPLTHYDCLSSTSKASRFLETKHTLRVCKMCFMLN